MEKIAGEELWIKKKQDAIPKEFPNWSLDSREAHGVFSFAMTRWHDGSTLDIGGH